MLDDKMPGCGLKAKPHIDSRIRLLKKQTAAIKKMMGPNASGFGWNDQDKCITAEKNIFDTWSKTHPNAKGLRNKPFAYYESLSIIFGNDCANGERVENAADSAEELSPGLNNREDGLEEIDLSNILTQTSCGTPNIGPVNAKKTGQRKRSIVL
ncbi:OLC1v1024214C1 [Oldenlandia corymbosa var. corymbosa]|uniref:OLC1v1024214C1 n=1 Tax=Oldenlandia corymbosa var. corymbosa TaxID=529605 RepID=A0AAV1C5A3_OLDCO|nr:OLC1v1024214C1 [Oldenlandia corymbosa var. corymbosa]